jgi:RluA family pseudouridine synthase
MNFKEFILFEDNDIVVLNKPTGLLSIPDGYDLAQPSLKNELAAEFGRIWAVHRLDKLTSGVILYAKNEGAHRDLNEQFNRHSISKNYRAITAGFPVWQEKSINARLRVNGDRRHRTIWDARHGKAAQTRVVLLYHDDCYSCLDVFPSTGLTHQIRAHLALYGLPIVGDPLYWHTCGLDRQKSADKDFHKDMYLHAYSIIIQHPANQQEMEFIAPQPAYFSSFLPH